MIASITHALFGIPANALVVLHDKQDVECHRTRDCLFPPPKAINYGGQTFIDTGETVSIGMTPFRKYREGFSTWDAGGPLS